MKVLSMNTTTRKHTTLRSLALNMAVDNDTSQNRTLSFKKRKIYPNLHATLPTDQTRGQRQEEDTSSAAQLSSRGYGKNTFAVMILEDDIIKPAANNYDA